MSNPYALTDHVALTAPARIHFGLFSTGGEKQFGGMGLMIREPATVVTVRRQSRMEISGLHPELTAQLVQRLLRRLHHASDSEFQSLESLPLHIRIERSAPRHAGFGTGTQIALAIANAVFQALNLPLPEVAKLTELMGRGRRSAVGSYGFFRGGCLVDSGKSANEPVAALELRLDFPLAWPVVLIRPRHKQGLNGQFESMAFDKLCGGESGSRERLTRLCRQSLVPAIRNEDYVGFAEPLAEFNRISGEYFSEYQNGSFNGPACAQIVEDVRRFGVNAVGQSSWGPCIFAIADNDDTAKALVSHLRTNCPAVGDESNTDISRTRANNAGMEFNQHHVTSRSYDNRFNLSQRMT